MAALLPKLTPSHIRELLRASGSSAVKWGELMGWLKIKKKNTLCKEHSKNINLTEINKKIQQATQHTMNFKVSKKSNFVKPLEEIIE